MPDVPVSSLPPRQQKLLENARTALGIGNHAYALEACAQILQTAPGCVEARRLHRQAQLRGFEERNNIISKAIGGLSSTPFIFSSATKDPLKAVASAERMLSADPTSASALKMLAEAAHGLDMMETVVFAREAVQELEPDDAENLRALADARLKVGRPTEALAAADELIRLKPLDASAQDLMRHAAIAQNQPAPERPAAPQVPPDPLDVARDELSHFCHWSRPSPTTSLTTVRSSPPAASWGGRATRWLGSAVPGPVPPARPMPAWPAWRRRLRARCSNFSSGAPRAHCSARRQIGRAHV